MERNILNKNLITDDSNLCDIAVKLESGKRLEQFDALYLFENAPLAWLGVLASNIKHQKFGNKVFFNRNIHVEISNICLNECKFCSYFRNSQSPEAWTLSHNDVISLIEKNYKTGISEVHIVGSLYKEYGIDFYTNLFRDIKNTWPSLHIKAFTAVEIEHLARQKNIDTNECIQILKMSGLNSVAGGGAEIFNKNVRDLLCPEKTSSDNWLRIHREIHQNGLPSNCTMLYGHIETYSDRVSHLFMLRELQDLSGGFNCFIPLKYKNTNNILNLSREAELSEDLRNLALSRIVLDNIAHVKAYWPMLGKSAARLCLHFGADDFDGTINDTTRIYSMAGSDEKNPEYSMIEMREAIMSEGFIPVERDSVYNELNFKC